MLQKVQPVSCRRCDFGGECQALPRSTSKRHFVGRVRRPELEEEARTLACRASHLELAAHRLHETPTDGEPESGCGEAVRAARRLWIERLEECGDDSIRDARSRIAYGELYDFAGALLRFHLDEPFHGASQR